METVHFIKNWRARSVMLLLSVLTNVTAWANTSLQSCIDVCKGGIGEVCISGWVYDSHFNLGQNGGYNVNVVLSTTLNENDDNYDVTYSDGYMEYVERPDVNEHFGITGIHGFKTRVPIVDPSWFDNSNVITVYVRIYANTGTGTAGIPLYEAGPIMVANHLGDGTAVSPFLIVDAPPLECDCRCLGRCGHSSILQQLSLSAGQGRQSGR